MTGERQSQLCDACSTPGRRAYSLVAHEQEGDSTDLTMGLCDTCAAEILALEWIEPRSP